MYFISSLFCFSSYISLQLIRQTWCTVIVHNRNICQNSNKGISWKLWAKPDHAFFTSLCEQTGTNTSMFSVCSRECNISGCEQLFHHKNCMQGSVKHTDSYSYMTVWQQTLCPAFTQSSEVILGLQARSSHSEQRYRISSKFRQLLSGLCNNSINQWSWLLPLMFYKWKYSTFYCNVS